MSDAACKRYCVAGRVQGVFFRASTAAEGRRLGLQGWARNLVDGRVEVIAFGPVQYIAELAKWLQDGPPLAKVSRVDAYSEDPQQFDEIEKPAGAVIF